MIPGTPLTILTYSDIGKMDIKGFQTGSRRRNLSKVRARLVDEFDFSTADAGRQLGVSSSAYEKALSWDHYCKNDDNSYNCTLLRD